MFADVIMWHVILPAGRHADMCACFCISTLRFMLLFSASGFEHCLHVNYLE